MWYIVRQETRVKGEWIHEYDFKPGEWTIAFFDDGFYGEIFRCKGLPEEKTIGRWAFDRDTGVISVEFLAEGSFAQRYIFDDEYLYKFGNDLYIPLHRGSIIAHHAHNRYRLEKVRR